MNPDLIRRHFLNRDGGQFALFGYQGHISLLALLALVRDWVFEDGYLKVIISLNIPKNKNLPHPNCFTNLFAVDDCQTRFVRTLLSVPVELLQEGAPGAKGQVLRAPPGRFNSLENAVHRLETDPVALDDPQERRQHLEALGVFRRRELFGDRL